MGKLGSGGTETLQFVEGAVVGTLQRGLVAREFGDGVAMLTIAQVLVGAPPVP